MLHQPKYFSHHPRLQDCIVLQLWTCLSISISSCLSLSKTFILFSVSFHLIFCQTLSLLFLALPPPLSLHLRIFSFNSCSFNFSCLISLAHYFFPYSPSCETPESILVCTFFLLNSFLFNSIIFHSCQFLSVSFLVSL